MPTILKVELIVFEIYVVFITQSISTISNKFWLFKPGIWWLNKVQLIERCKHQIK